MSEEIVVRGAVMPLTEKARETFSQGLVNLLSEKAKGADFPTLHAWLELAARYDLNPVANEIWCVNMGGRNGGPASWAVLVGRDGYMKIAKRDDPAFIACPGVAVYENDFFAAEYVDDEIGWKVEHKITQLADRGRLLGAWSKLLRRGLPTLFFFAPLEQFKKDPSKSAWSYTDAMIAKCAVSYLLRTTYNVSGPAPADELAVGFDAEATATEDPAGPDLPEAIAPLLERARSLDPTMWRENEVFARLDGTPETEATVAAELEAWLAEHEPAEAEVVEEPPASDESAGYDEGRSIEEVEAVADVDPPTLPTQERYELDEAWRQEVDSLLHRKADLEAVEASGDEEAEIDAEVNHLDAQLEKLGVPAGWMPVTGDQAVLEV